MKMIFTLVDHSEAKICFSWVLDMQLMDMKDSAVPQTLSGVLEYLKVGLFHFSGAAFLSIRWSFAPPQLRSLNSPTQLRPEDLVVCVFGSSLCLGSRLACADCDERLDKCAA